MKKQITIILFLVSLTIAGKAQNRHLFGMQTSVGTSFTGTTDAWGYTMANEFDFYPTQNLRVGLNFEMQNHYGIGSSIVNYANLGLNVNYNLNLYRNVVFMNFGIGGFVRNVHFEPNYESIYNCVWFYKSYTIGYSTNLSLVVRLTDKIDFVPLGLYLQNDTDGNITWSARTSLIYKF